jgi:hypothetical protein
MFTKNAETMLKDYAIRSYSKEKIKINDRIFCYVGWGHSNVTVIEGDTSLILIDALDSDERSKRLLADLNESFHKPVKTIIFTHGHPDHRALLKTLELNHTLLQGVAKAMKASYAVNGIVKYNTMLDEGKTEAALKELESKLKKSESGFLPLDLKSEFVPIKKEIKLVDEATLKFIDEKILRNFGVPLCILTGDYNKEQYEAFYQKTLEPLIIMYSQSFTKTLFSDRERGFGNKVKFYPKELLFMSVDQTLAMVTLLSNTGALYENEKRVAFGLKPLAELEGKRFMSLNWIDATKANEYQTGNSGGENSEPETDDN